MWRFGASSARFLYIMKAQFLQIHRPFGIPFALFCKFRAVKLRPRKTISPFFRKNATAARIGTTAGSLRKYIVGKTINTPFG